MDIYENESALFNIQAIIVKKIKSSKEKDVNKLKEELQPLFEERSEIIMGNTEIIEKYKLGDEKNEY